MKIITKLTLVLKYDFINMDNLILRQSLFEFKEKDNILETVLKNRLNYVFQVKHMRESF